MRRIMLGLVLSSLAPGDASACTCSGPRSAAEAHMAAVVFQGRVIRIETSAEAWKSESLNVDPVEVELEVSRVWRGSLGSTVVITTGFGGGDCGFSFEIGMEYVVPAYAGERGLGTGLCGGVEPAQAARASVLALGPGSAPTLDGGPRNTEDPWELGVRGDRIAVAEVLFAYSTLALAVLSALCLRLWREDRRARRRAGGAD